MRITIPGEKPGKDPLRACASASTNVMSVRLVLFLLCRELAGQKSIPAVSTPSSQDSNKHPLLIKSSLRQMPPSTLECCEESSEVESSVGKKWRECFRSVTLSDALRCLAEGVIPSGLLSVGEEGRSVSSSLWFDRKGHVRDDWRLGGWEPPTEVASACSARVWSEILLR